MSERQRQSIMLMVEIRLGAERSRVRVKDISAGGLKVAVSVPSPRPGSKIQVELPNIGWKTGIVAWAANGQFGIRFDVPIDPAAVRQQITGNFAARASDAAINLRRIA